MKKIILPVFLAASLVSCTESNVSNSEVVTQIPATTQTAIEETTAQPEPESGFEFSVTDNGVEILNLDNQFVQIIDGDFITELSIYEDVAPETFLVNADYDFDGYEDLFIPIMVGRPSVPGIYYHFNPDTSLFEEWDELNSVGYGMDIGEDNTLINCARGSAVDHETTHYQWVNNVLTVVHREVQYYGSDSQIYIDGFDYDEDGNDTLVSKKMIIHDENNNYIGTEDVALEPIQRESSFSISEINTDEHMIFDDFDFDGYDDIVIPYSIGTLYTSAVYYRFNPENERYEEWDQLNEIGRLMLIEPETSILKWGGNSGDYWLEYFKYKWQDGKIVLFEHDVTETGSDWEYYSVDADGNETLIPDMEG